MKDIKTAEDLKGLMKGQYVRYNGKNYQLTQDPGPDGKFAPEAWRPIDKTEDYERGAYGGLVKGATDLGHMAIQGVTSLLPTPLRDVARAGVSKVTKTPAIADYEPTGNVARYAKAGSAGAVAGAPFGPMGVLSGATGGVGGEAGHDIVGNRLDFKIPFTDTTVEGGRLAGSTIGGVLPNAVQWVATGGPARVVRKATQDMNRSQWRKAENDQALARSEGVQLSGPEAMNNPELLQKQLLFENGPATATKWQQFMQQRPDQVKAATQTRLAAVGPQSADPRLTGAAMKEGADQLLQGMERDRSRDVSSLYRAADAEQVPQAEVKALVDAIDATIAADKTGILHPDLKDFRSRLLERDAIPAVPAQRTKGANGIYTHTPQVPAQPPIYITDIENLDRARKYMRGRMQQPAWGVNATEKEAGGVLGDSIADLRNKMESASGNFLAARDKFENLSQPINAATKSIPGALSATEDMPTQWALLKDPQRSRPEGVRGVLTDMKNMREPAPVSELVRTGLGNDFDEGMALLQGTGQQYGGARFARAMRRTDQTSANITAAVHAAGGQQAVDGFNRLLDVLEMTGRRIPTGSRTAFNNMALDDMNAGNLLKMAAQSPTDLGGNFLKQLNERYISRRLTDVMQDPESVKLLHKLAYLDPQSQKARMVAASLLGYQAGQEPSK